MIKTVIKACWVGLAIVFLTVLTQIGGVVYLLPMLTYRFVDRKPHLKTRLKLSSAKIRFHGCQAVRHDDHIHVQLR